MWYSFSLSLLFSVLCFISFTGCLSPLIFEQWNGIIWTLSIIYVTLSAPSENASKQNHSLTSHLKDDSSSLGYEFKVLTLVFKSITFWLKRWGCYQQSHADRTFDNGQRCNTTESWLSPAQPSATQQMTQKEERRLFDNSPLPSDACRFKPCQGELRNNKN